MSNSNNFLSASEIPIGSWWAAADNSKYGYTVLSVDSKTKEATVISTTGEQRKIDTFKLQYRYFRIKPNEPPREAVN